MRIKSFPLEDDLQMIVQGWLDTETSISKSSRNYLNRIIKQGWFDSNDDIILNLFEQEFYNKKRANPKGLSPGRVAPEYVKEFKKWLEVPNWLQDKDVEILERGLQDRYLDEEDWITVRVLDWAWQEEVNWEDAPFKKRTHNIINTLEDDELITDYIRGLYHFTSLGSVKKRITQIKLDNGLELNSKKEILEFRQDLCFIRDYQVYNGKWKDILNSFDRWFRQMYLNYWGREYHTLPSEHKNLSVMFGDKLYIQQKGWGDKKRLDELKREFW